MDFQTILAKRRSTRRFLPRPVPRELIDALLRDALTAPSARNSRSTRFLAVDDPALIARMAEMRDYGSSFMRHAPAVVLVLGNPTKSDLWRENAAIAATILQLACVDRGLASCWVHVHGRPAGRMRPRASRPKLSCANCCPYPGKPASFAPWPSDTPTSPRHRCRQPTTNPSSGSDANATGP